VKVFIHIVLFGFVAAGSLHAGDKDKTAEKLEHKIVDSGSFGIFVGGRRIGTETFKIEQGPEVGVVTAQIKVNSGKGEAAQSAEMRVAPNGELRSYTWHSTQPDIESASVEPQNELLVEHLVLADQKKKDIPHMLSPTTVILDNNFFSQREVLLWRYLQSGCVWKEGQGRMCGPSSYAILVPQDHSSANATLTLLGTDKVTVKGAEKLLNKVTLQLGDPKQLVIMNGSSDPDPGQWVLWVDDQYKIVKITVVGSNFEVVRD
jgi:hypothetical protein